MYKSIFKMKLSGLAGADFVSTRKRETIPFGAGGHTACTYPSRFHKLHSLGSCFKLAIATLILSLPSGQAAFAQGSTTLHNPLIPGYQQTPPFVPPRECPPPPVGDGPTPAGINPGMPGPPPLLPWVPAIPANQIDRGSSGVNLPVGPPVETPPGILGPALTGFVPRPPSTPGPDPGPLQSPPGFIIPADRVLVNIQGGLPGTGGYFTTINKIRRGGQQSRQWDTFSGFRSVFGGGGRTQDEVTLTGPLAGFGLPFGVPTGNGYNKGPAGSNNDLRHSAIDLGGGQRLKIGGTKISSGSSLQDCGLSSLRNRRDIPALNGHQSTEFGQGFRRIRRPFSHKTTDFGFPYTPFDPRNVTAQKQAQLGRPTAILTNF